jgi:hypothetical protein
MDTHPYYYNNAHPWIAPQPQFPDDRGATARSDQQLSQRQRQQEAAPVHLVSKPKPMPKSRALALTRTLKKWLVATSLVGFLSFSGLVAFHQAESTASSSQTTVTSSGSSQTNSPSSEDDDSNSFLQQQGGNTGGTDTTSQAPVSGTHTS